MTTAMATGSVGELWQGLVRDAEARAAVRLDEDQESYLVFTLVRHCRDQILVARTLALELLDGLALRGELGSDRLRDVGDRCLLLAGLFPGQARRRSVDEGYYLDLGRSAYGELGARRRDALADLYLRLAEAFAPLVRILRHVRADGAGNDSPEVAAMAGASVRPRLPVAGPKSIQVQSHGMPASTH